VRYEVVLGNFFSNSVEWGILNAKCCWFGLIEIVRESLTDVSRYGQA
jgi:hypothetical protein